MSLQRESGLVGVLRRLLRQDEPARPAAMSRSGLLQKPSTASASPLVSGEGVAQTARAAAVVEREKPTERPQAESGGAQPTTTESAAREADGAAAPAEAEARAPQSSAGPSAEVGTAELEPQSVATQDDSSAPGGESDSAACAGVGDATAPAPRGGDSQRSGLPHSHDVQANVLSLTSVTRNGELDERSQRRLWERLSELDQSLSAVAWECMSPEERRTALSAAITRFEERERGGDLISRISAVAPPQRRRADDRPRAETVGANSAVVQALANSWPQVIFDRMMSQEQAYAALAAVVRWRGLEFNEDAVNVIGMRAYQGGSTHGNEQNQVFYRANTYNDTQFIVWRDDQGMHVRQARSTVDSGAGRDQGTQRSDDGFNVAADQSWDYRGYARAQSRHYDRAEYDPVNPQVANRGRYWQQHRAAEAAALQAGGDVRRQTDGRGRIIEYANGEMGTDRRENGRANRVSALHSGGSGGVNGELVGGDSIGCSVVHGDWFGFFNESLIEASAGTQVRVAREQAERAAEEAASANAEAENGADIAAVASRRVSRRRSGGATRPDGRTRFTYSLLDPRMFDRAELNAKLNEHVPPTSMAEGEND